MPDYGRARVIPFAEAKRELRRRWWRQRGIYLVIFWSIAAFGVVTIVTLTAAHGSECPRSISAGVCAACLDDVRTICPGAYAKRNGTAIGRCMRAHAPVIGKAPHVSWSCVGAWLTDHPRDKK